MNINTEIVTFQTSEVCGSCLIIFSKWQMKGIHLLNRFFWDMLPINYTTPKLKEYVLAITVTIAEILYEKFQFIRNIHATAVLTCGIDRVKSGLDFG
jgi:hypothetical protein